MSSPPKEKHETRAGHLPAVKAGGMRIVQKHQSAGDSASDRKEDKDSKEFESCSPPKPVVVVSGVVTKVRYRVSPLLSGESRCSHERTEKGGCASLEGSKKAHGRHQEHIGDKDFTPAAAQVAHTKPVPAVQKLPPAHHINQHIHQPRK